MLMNDSPYGLTASIWTNADGNSTSEAAFTMLVEALETGTVFLNRWVGSSMGIFWNLISQQVVIIWILL